MGFDAILVTVGAQGTKWLGLPGEELTGVYHAKDLVYHCLTNCLRSVMKNSTPSADASPSSAQATSCSTSPVGASAISKVDEVVSVVRRDPAAVKFTKKEMSIVFENLDIATLDAGSSARPIMEAVGNDPEAA